VVRRRQRLAPGDPDRHPFGEIPVDRTGHPAYRPFG
jgi:hypothetical protein